MVHIKVNLCLWIKYTYMQTITLLKTIRYVKSSCNPWVFSSLLWRWCVLFATNTSSPPMYLLNLNFAWRIVVFHHTQRLGPQSSQKYLRTKRAQSYHPSQFKPSSHDHLLYLLLNTHYYSYWHSPIANFILLLLDQSWLLSFNMEFLITT